MKRREEKKKTRREGHIPSQTTKCYTQYIKVAGKVPSKIVPRLTFSHHSLKKAYTRTLPGFPSTFGSLEKSRKAGSSSVGGIRSVSIGINYDGDLKGCHNDATSMYQWILSLGGRRQNMQYLADDGVSPTPTRNNIRSAWSWLLQTAQEGETLFFTYSGHGSSQRDSTGTEKDGKMEVIIPYDFDTENVITDDEMWTDLNFYLSAKPSVTLVALFDCCHSGTVLDLTSNWDVNKDGKSLVYSYDSPKRETKAQAIAWSGCLDNQTSADVSGSGKAHGAFTKAFLSTDSWMKSQSSPTTYEAFNLHLEQTLRSGGYSQRSRFSASRKLKLNEINVHFPF